MALPVELAGSATFGADGVATVRFDTVPPFQLWRLYRLSVSATSTNRTAAQVYRSSATPANLLDSAPYSGNDDTTDTVFDLRAGESLIVQWTGGTPGAVATVTATGEQVAG